MLPYGVKGSDSTNSNYSREYIWPLLRRDHEILYPFLNNAVWKHHRLEVRQQDLIVDKYMYLKVKQNTPKRKPSRQKLLVYSCQGMRWSCLAGPSLSCKSRAMRGQEGGIILALFCPESAKTEFGGCCLSLLRSLRVNPTNFLYFPYLVLLHYWIWSFAGGTSVPNSAMYEAAGCLSVPNSAFWPYR